MELEFVQRNFISWSHFHELTGNGRRMHSDEVNLLKNSTGRYLDSIRSRNLCSMKYLVDDFFFPTSAYVQSRYLIFSSIHPPPATDIRIASKMIQRCNVLTKTIPFIGDNSEFRFFV